jgi:cysteine sulfinate desulfinase/cysteine desulfurase-like protein
MVEFSCPALNVSFVGQIGAEILTRLDGIAASTGSACHSGRIELSPVLEAMGIAPEVGSFVNVTVDPAVLATVFISKSEPIR